MCPSKIFSVQHIAHNGVDALVGLRLTNDVGVICPGENGPQLVAGQLGAGGDDLSTGGGGSSTVGNDYTVLGKHRSATSVAVRRDGDEGAAEVTIFEDVCRDGRQRRRALESANGSRGDDSSVRDVEARVTARDDVLGEMLVGLAEADGGCGRVAEGSRVGWSDDGWFDMDS
jgi:hypothetical protein